MRYLTADFVFPIHKPPVKNGIIVVDKGLIVDLLDPLIQSPPTDLAIERFSGILCPGFINTHCHLELSHLKGKLTPKKYLTGFIEEIIAKRNDSDDFIIKSMYEADKEMYDQGIVAVGDISNSKISGEVKKVSNILYHTFIELFDIKQERADEIFSNGLLLEEHYQKENLLCSIVPHAPYTVSQKLFKLISDHALKSNGILSIHNQESEGENEMFLEGKGSLIEKLKMLTGGFSDWKSQGKSSIASVVDFLVGSLKLQLVHNTYSSKSDIKNANEKHKNLFWCLCPNANLFIEDTLPNVQEMINERCMITIGTDSNASNNSLSVLEEIKTIQKFFPTINLESILQWSTYNGAKFLGVDHFLGTLESGKRPSINLLTQIDLQNQKFTSRSMVQRVV
jgi:cytosine/adenosine deaminase-related metal-dependent hydrolase